MATPDVTREHDDPRLVLLREHARMIALVMATTDAVETYGQQLDFPAVKKAIGRQLRESIGSRDAALRELGLDEIPEDVADPGEIAHGTRIPYAHRPSLNRHARQRDDGV